MQFVNNIVSSLIARIHSREEGQTLVEYGLIIALVSVVAIVGLMAIGDELGALFDEIATTLAG